MKFAMNNYNVTIVGRNYTELEQLRVEIEQENREEVLVCAGDLAKKEFLEQVIEDTVQKWGRINVFINNAACRTIETMRKLKIITGRTLIQDKYPISTTKYYLNKSDNMVKDFNELKFGAPCITILPDNSIYIAFWCYEKMVSNIRWIKVKI